MSTTIRVSERTRDRIAALAETTNRPMTAVVEQALDALERRVFFAEFNERYRELRDDPLAWAEIETERDVEASVLHDRSS